MSNLDFHTLEIENFKSFRSRQVLDFRVYGAGLYFVKGWNFLQPSLDSNGSGKSSIWDALCWCATGRTIAGDRGTDIRPWVGGGPTDVLLAFSRDGSSHLLRRTASPNRLLLDGKEASQDQIDSLILPYEILTQTILLGQGRPLLMDLQPKAQLEIFSEVLQLEVWEKRSKFVSDVAKGLEADLKSAEWRSVSLGASIDEIRSGLAEAQSRSSKWKENRTAKLNSCRDRTRALEKKLKELRCEASTRGSAAEKIVEELEDVEGALARCTEMIIREEKEEAVLLNTKRSLETRSKKLRREINELKESGVCASCGQKVKDRQVHLGHLREELSSLEKKVPDMARMEEGLASLRKESSNLSRSCYRLSQEYEKAQCDLTRCRNAVADSEAEKAELSQELLSLKSERSPYEGELENSKVRLASLKEERALNKERVSVLKARLSRAEYWVKGFKDVRIFALGEVLQGLQMVTDALLPELGLQDWKVEYCLDKELKSGEARSGFDVVVTNRRLTKKTKFGLFSRGEGQRLRLAVSLALSEILLERVGIVPNLEVLDEPTSGLSQPGVQDLCECLAYRAKRLGRKTFYVDHMVVESTFLAGVLTVENTRRGSILKGT